MSRLSEASCAGHKRGAEMAAPSVPLALSIAIRLNGLAFSLFWSGAFMVLLLGIDLGPRLTPLIRWGAHGDEYAMMLCSLYIPWGVFLWRAAAQPWRNKMLIDFTLVANAGHYGLMTLMALLMSGERQHLLGDVLLGWLGLLPLLLTWLPYRWRMRNAPAEAAC
jgi:hypothetical protein